MGFGDSVTPRSRLARVSVFLPVASPAFPLLAVWLAALLQGQSAGAFGGSWGSWSSSLSASSQARLIPPLLTSRVSHQARSNHTGAFSVEGTRRRDSGLSPGHPIWDTSSGLREAQLQTPAPTGLQQGAPHWAVGLRHPLYEGLPRELLGGTGLGQLLPQTHAGRAP